MERPRGTRVDEVEGGFDITVFGVYTLSTPSKHFHVKHPRDLQNIADQINKLFEEKKDVSTEGKPEA